MKIFTEIEISDERTQDLLCNALEGGSNNWCLVTAYNFPPNINKRGYEFPYLELPFDEGGSITIIDKEAQDAKEYKLDKIAIERGLRVMAKNYPKHFHDFINGNDDAITGDVFLQCCLFGEIIYG